MIYHLGIETGKKPAVDKLICGC